MKPIKFFVNTNEKCTYTMSSVSCITLITKAFPCSFCVNTSCISMAVIVVCDTFINV